MVAWCQPWFYLRLEAYSFFWLSEGAYGSSSDSVPEHQAQRRYGYSPSNQSIVRTDEPPPGMSLEMEESSNDAQAACGFSWSASKRTPFFHTSKVMAAILRASVSRAIGGFMPLAISDA